jgi:hypothetical protein
MLGSHVKRGVTATLERTLSYANHPVAKLDVLWHGETAGITFERKSDGIHATVIFPAIDELCQIDKPLFNNLIGFALHEGLGHAIFTDNAPWDSAVAKHGKFLGKLINGLEDPRIEQRVIDSPFAPNSKVLFETLLNSMLDKHGYVEPDDLKNIPFLLAVEGRRLNGYQVNVPSIIDQSPLAAEIRVALDQARASTTTHRVVDAALSLHAAIKLQGAKKKSGTQSTSDPNKPPQSDPAQPEGGSEDLDSGREVEPTDFIESELGSKKLNTDRYSPRPEIGEVRIAKFEWV